MLGPDAEFVLGLARELRAVGANLWLDQLDIPVGKRWDFAVEEALRSCECVIVVLTCASVASDNVMDEVSFALEEGKHIIPIVQEQCNIPFRLRRVQHVDFKGGYNKGFAELLTGLGLDKSSNASEPLEPKNTHALDIPPPSDELHTESMLTHPASACAQRVSKALPFKKRLPLLLWVSAVAYITFTVTLKTSTADDTQAGSLFILNAMAITVGSVLSSLGMIPASRVCAACALIQIAIMIAMLSLSLGEPVIVVPINIGIASGFCGMMLFYQNKERKGQAPGETNPVSR